MKCLKWAVAVFLSCDWLLSRCSAEDGPVHGTISQTGLSLFLRPRPQRGLPLLTKKKSSPPQQGGFPQTSLPSHFILPILLLVFLPAIAAFPKTHYLSLSLCLLFFLSLPPSIFSWSSFMAHCSLHCMSCCVCMSDWEGHLCMRATPDVISSFFISQPPTPHVSQSQWRPELHSETQNRSMVQEKEFLY